MMVDDDNKVSFLITCFLALCLIFIILYFAIVYEERTTMINNSKYNSTLEWALDFVNNKLYDSSYKFNIHDSIKNKDMLDIVEKQIKKLYPTNNTPKFILNVFSFHFITIKKVKDFKQYYNYSGLSRYEETTMKFDPNFSEASKWATYFKQKRAVDKNYKVDEYDIKMMDITADIVLKQINKIYPSNKIKKSLLRLMAFDFINISIVFVFRELYEKNKLHQIV